MNTGRGTRVQLKQCSADSMQLYGVQIGDKCKEKLETRELYTTFTVTQPNVVLEKDAVYPSGKVTNTLRIYDKKH